MVCCLSTSGNAASGNGQVNANHERASLTLGTQWILPAPAHVFHDQNGECSSCGAGYFPFWTVEWWSSSYNQFSSYLRVRTLEEASGCQFPSDCPSGFRATFLAIDSKKMRKHHHARIKDRPYNIYKYCLQSIYGLFGNGSYQEIEFYIPDITTFCFSEMPMPESLVVYTNDDFLGDHDCGVYPPRGNNRKVAEPVETLLSSEGEPFSGSGSSSGLNDIGSSGAMADIRFLDGGEAYSQVITVSSGKELLDLLPLKQSTVIIVRPEAVSSGSADSGNGSARAFSSGSADSGSGSPAAINSGSGSAEILSWPVTGDRYISQDLNIRTPYSKRLEHTGSYPEIVGHRGNIFTISSQDILDYSLNHPTARQTGLIDLAESGSVIPSLMLIGQGEGVKLRLDAKHIRTLRQNPLFEIRGAVQLYNIDIEAELPEGGRLFQVDHHLQLYRSSLTLHTPGKLFTGSGLVTASRSLLRENGASGNARERDDCLMLRSCRSEITLNDWQVSPDALTAMNGNYSYFDDYLDRAELLLPVKPKDYHQSILTKSSSNLTKPPLNCEDIASQALIPSNWLSQQSVLPPELRAALCPEVDSALSYNRLFSQSLTVPAAQWQESNCRCGHFVDTTMVKEAGTECPDISPSMTFAPGTASSGLPEPGASPAAPISSSENSSSNAIFVIGLFVSVTCMIVILTCLHFSPDSHLRLENRPGLPDRF